MANPHAPPAAQRQTHAPPTHQAPAGERAAEVSRRSFDWLAGHPPLVQGIYYLATGVWPWISMSSFLWVTGPKTDLWLVETVGLLIAVIGITLIVAAVRHETNVSVVCLALGSALGLALAEGLFVVQGRVPFIYLLDAFVEVALALLWLYALLQHRYRLSRSVEDAPAGAAAPRGTPLAGSTVYLVHPSAGGPGTAVVSTGQRAVPK